MQILSTILILLFLIPFSGDQEKAVPRLQWLSFEEGIKQAEKTNKKIMVDVYTTWCGWCKKLDAEVYADSGVAACLRDNYICIKINAESSKKLTYKGEKFSEQELAAAFGATGYPTIVFLEPDAKPITKLGGFVAADRFLKIITFFGKDYYKTMKWDDFIQMGKADTTGEKKQ